MKTVEIRKHAFEYFEHSQIFKQSQYNSVRIRVTCIEEKLQRNTFKPYKILKNNCLKCLEKRKMVT